MTRDLPNVDLLKDQAKRLRQSLAATGNAITHSQALEALAGQYGLKDWNTLSALAGAIPNRRSYRVGDRVRGTYLGQPFEGRIKGAHALSGGSRHRLTIRFDKPVDVVTFESFSAYRRQVTCTVDDDGVTASRTSDGRPHMVLG